jgi:hypothetical protein|tara:strand:- start:398 stop:667 length:270 start_codon:yes stop_codon:yes gene_type:complete
MYKAIHRKSKERVYRRKHPTDKDKATRTSYELSSHRFSLNGQARRYGLDSEELKLSWEEIEAIPCITDTKCNEYVKEGNQYILKERNSK